MSVDDSHITDEQYRRAIAAYQRACLAEAKAEQARIIRQLARQAEAYRRRHPDEVA